MVATLALMVAVFGLAVAALFLIEGSSAPLDLGSDWAGFFQQAAATVVGALIAAGVSYHLASSARRDNDREAAFRLLTKVALITNDLHSTFVKIDEMLMEANNENRTHFLMWQRVKPILGIGEPTTIDPGDLIPFLKYKASHIANKAIELSVCQRSFHTALAKYNVLRNEIVDLIKIDRVEGALIGGQVSPEDAARVQARSNELDHLIREILASGRRYLAMALVLSEQIGPTAQRILDDKAFPTLTPPPAPPKNASVEHGER